ncbi:hypothetical protein CKO45_06125 [Paracraurococcus ruber]|uniref:Uncharacterized protein n=1 Tax=Paracraurococcus ruber TaxID=77675 RepID=A0ABS1CTJ8_9PROT|nr:hypothetical protein [Paracraurococcus ruber]
MNFIPAEFSPCSLTEFAGTPDALLDTGISLGSEIYARPKNYGLPHDPIVVEGPLRVEPEIAFAELAQGQALAIDQNHFLGVRALGHVAEPLQRFALPIPGHMVPKRLGMHEQRPPFRRTLPLSSLQRLLLAEAELMIRPGASRPELEIEGVAQRQPVVLGEMLEDVHVRTTTALRRVLDNVDEGVRDGVALAPVPDRLDEAVARAANLSGAAVALNPAMAAAEVHGNPGVQRPALLLGEEEGIAEFMKVTAGEIPRRVCNGSHRRASGRATARQKRGAIHRAESSL